MCMRFITSVSMFIFTPFQHFKCFHISAWTVSNCVVVSQHTGISVKKIQNQLEPYIYSKTSKKIDRICAMFCPLPQKSSQDTFDVWSFKTNEASKRR